jgi:hypothetical protein
MTMKPRHAAFILVASLFAASALAAPKIDSIIVKPNPAAFAGGKPPEVEVSVTVTRTRFDSGNCDARVEFGDGEGRTVDFGVAQTRTVRHVYKKGGNYSLVAKGVGKSPCEGTRDVALNVTGGPTEKKAAAKKAPEKKVAKNAVKKAPAKKNNKKKDGKKKAEKKKDEPK